MRLDDVDICNQAIGLCGSTQWIQSLTDQTTAARRCERFFQSSVEKVLRKHDWHCASTNVSLAQNTDTPTVTYEYAYALPFDCVRLVEVYSSANGYSPYDRWEPQGRNIETDIDALYIRYVKMPEDYRELDILLADAIAYELAVMLAPTLVSNAEIYGILKQASQKALADAKAIDTLESKQLYAENDVWEDARTSVGN